MFTPEEIEALVLGSCWIADRADDPLRNAARSALTRIAAVLPTDLRDELDTSALLIDPGGWDRSGIAAKGIRTERKLSLRYRYGTGAASARISWPFALTFFDSVRVLLGWCELRQGLRHFSTDRIVSATPIEARYRKRRQTLLKEWREEKGITKRPDQPRTLLPETDSRPG